MKLTKILWQARAQSDAQQTSVRRPQSWLTLALLFGTLWPAACQPIRSPDPRTVVQTYLDAAVAHDLTAALAQTADDITHTDTHAPPGLPSVTQGKAAYGAYLQGALDDPAYRLEYDNLQADGERVTWTTQEWFDPQNTPPNFPLPIESQVTAVVAQGKISSLLLENDPTWLAKLYTAIPPEVIDPASVTELWIKAFNAGDGEALQALMADDMVLTIVYGKPDDPILKGKAAILEWMQSRHADHFTLETGSLLSDGAALATVTGNYSGIGDEIRARNGDPERGRVEVSVENGVIKMLNFLADEMF